VTPKSFDKDLLQILGLCLDDVDSKFISVLSDERLSCFYSLEANEQGLSCMVESTVELSTEACIEDIAERRKAEEASRESKEKYRTLFEEAMDAIFVADAETGIIVDCNRAATELVGRTRSELIGKHQRILHPQQEDTGGGLSKTFQQHLREKEGQVLETQVITKRGEIKEVAIKANLVELNGKKVLQGTFRDITERRKAEEALRESEEKFRTIFENVNEVIVYVDNHGKILDVSERSTEIFGYKKDEVIGKNFLRVGFLGLRDAPKIARIFKDVLISGKDSSLMQLEIKHKNGSMVHVEVSSRLLRKNDKIEGFLCIVRDITERKRAELALKESEEKFRSIFEGVADGLIYLDRFGKILEVNRRAVEILGGSEEELLGKRFTKIGIFSFKETMTLMGNLAGILRGKKTILNLNIKNKKGQVISLECSTSLLKTGSQTMIATVLRDISERREAEEALRQSEERFRSLFERSPEALAYVDSQFEILDSNPRFTELFGYTREEARGKNLDSLIVPADRIDEAEKLGERAAEGYVYHDTVRKTKHGLLVPVSVSAAPIVVKGVLIGYVAVYKDISHLKKAEEALTVMNEKLRVIGGLTRHDARNRLSLVTTNAYLVKECLRGNNEAESYLEKIEGAVNDVVGIFDFAKIYEMLGVEKPTYVDVAKAVNEAVSLFPALETVKVMIGCHGLAVLADSLLRQAFYNLIDDSLKYAQNLTQIKVYYERMDNDHLRLVYEDNGAGIPFDKKSMLFQRGYTSGKGSGYGLYLIQKMMEIYGWTIQETGEPGKGARFVMEIPKFNKEGKELYCLDAKA
jgi:PAS domain S-box-containing protein